MGKKTAVDSMLDTQTPPSPWTPALQGASVLTDLVTFFINRADQKKAAKEAQAIDARNFAYGKERDAFSEGMQTKTYGLAKQGQAFNQKQTVAGNVLGINAAMLQKMTDAINNNEQLKNTVIGRWGA
jgi:hypothetical protein